MKQNSIKHGRETQIMITTLKSQVITEGIWNQVSQRHAEGHINRGASHS